MKQQRSEQCLRWIKKAGERREKLKKSAWHDKHSGGMTCVAHVGFGIAAGIALPGAGDLANAGSGSEDARQPVC